jgi:hypothetical protein
MALYGVFVLLFVLVFGLQFYGAMAMAGALTLGTCIGSVIVMGLARRRNLAK